MVLIGVGAVLRLALILTHSPVLGNDSASYLDLAHRLGAWHLAGGSGSRTPGYPALLLVLGYSPTAAWCLQAVIGILSSLLVYRLVLALGGWHRVALLAALLFSCDLEFLELERTILTETVTTFLLLLAGTQTVSLLRGSRSRSAGSNRIEQRAAFVLALAVCALCLVRPDMLAVSAFFALSCALGAARGTGSGTWRTRLRRSGAGRRAVRLLLATLAPALAALIGWAIVNRETIGVTTVSTVLGHNMIDHMAPEVRVQPGGDRPITAVYVAARSRRLATTSNLANLSYAAETAMERAAHLDTAHLSGRLLSIGLHTALAHPFAYLRSSIRQWPSFFLPPNYADQFRSGPIRLAWKLERAVRLLIGAAFVLLCAGALIASRVGRRTGMSVPAGVLAAAVGIGLLVASFLAFGETGRYGTVYYPFMLAITLTALPRQLRAWREAPISRRQRATDRDV